MCGPGQDSDIVFRFAQ